MYIGGERLRTKETFGLLEGNCINRNRAERSSRACSHIIRIVDDDSVGRSAASCFRAVRKIDETFRHETTKRSPCPEYARRRARVINGRKHRVKIVSLSVCVSYDVPGPFDISVVSSVERLVRLTSRPWNVSSVKRLVRRTFRPFRRPRTCDRARAKDPAKSESKIRRPCRMRGEFGELVVFYIFIRL